MSIEIVNRQYYKPSFGDVKINIMKTEGSPLGNPHYKSAFSDAGRGRAIALYRQWLWNKIKMNDPLIVGALREIAHLHRQGKNVKLECVCVPKPCHGAIIKNAVEWLIMKNLNTAGYLELIVPTVYM